MKYSIQKSSILKLIEHRNGYLILASGLLLLCFLLVCVIGILIGHERTIIVPPTVHQSFWVNNSHVSAEYLSEMSLFFCALRFNITPSNITFQHETLLRYIDPRYYSTLKAVFLTEADHVQKQHINTVFYPVDIKLDTKNLQTLVTGDLWSAVGNANLPMQRLTYQISYSYQQGQLRIIGFEEKKENA
jgi:conjugal transfer pilus assembly protein TraE